MAVTTAFLASLASPYPSSTPFLILSHMLESSVTSILRIVRKVVVIILILRVLSDYPSWLVSKRTYF